MSMKQKIQDAMKDAMRNKDTVRLECLRMAKGALLLKEKEGAQGAELSGSHDAVQCFTAMGARDPFGSSGSMHSPLT